MGNGNLRDAGQKRVGRHYALLLCAVSLAINILGVRLAVGLKLPLYLDNVGTVLAAALGGYIPGIVVGFLTNLINGIFDYSTAYYGSLMVLIALFAAWFAQRGDFGKPWKLPLIAVTFALIGGGLGSVLTWMLYGFSFGEGISAPLAHRFYNSGGFSMFWAQFAADMLIDLADKAITVSVIAVVLKLMPERLRGRFLVTGWQQTPLSKKNLVAAERSQSRRISLRLKIVFLVVAAMLIVVTGVTLISFIHFRTAAIDEQITLAGGVVNVVEQVIDADRVEEFVQKGEAAEGYAQVDAIVNDLASSTDSIQYVYAYKIMEDGCHVVFDADTKETPGSEPGTVIEFDEAFSQYLPALLAGETIEPIISNEKYGWLLTVYKPIYDSQGVCQCYAGVDIDMSHIATSGYQFLARVVSLFFGFFLLLLTVSIWAAEYNVILPINSMAIATGRFAYDAQEARSDTLERLRAMDIHTGDEIENLYHAVVKTTEDMVRYIAHVQQQSQQIGKLQNGLIMVLADMVESRDKCTGDHVRKTAAYTEIIMRQLRRDGIYTDQLTDEFMRDVVNSAPLHDVGKISVSDTLLNKPGKLTDEEFELMKGHTTAGAEVISRAIDMVSGDTSGYLTEARNMALYHHEKWNGMGYPKGLKGDEIPLSARIMAVADVFDALVSARSYKPGFPFEKAMGIIRESAGTHFDPNVAQAFIEAGDEAKRIMEMQMEG